MISSTASALKQKINISAMSLQQEMVFPALGGHRAQHFPLQQGHAPQITHKWGTGWEAFNRPEGLEFTSISPAARDNSGLIKLKVCYIAC